MWNCDTIPWFYLIMLSLVIYCYVKSKEKILDIPIWACIALLTSAYFFYEQNKKKQNSKHNAKPVNKHIKKLEKFAEPKTKVTAYNFNTSWCGYSTRFQPTWDKFADTVDDNYDGTVKVVDVKCDQDEFKDMCSKYNVQGYPTVIFEVNGKPQAYNGARTVDALVNTLDSYLVK
jgi:thiol-disulfide isomerase/thioredoxin